MLILFLKQLLVFEFYRICEFILWLCYAMLNIIIHVVAFSDYLQLENKDMLMSVNLLV